MKWLSKKSVLLLLLVVTLNSCRKEVSVNTYKNNADLIHLNDAKAFFYEEILPNSPLTLAKKDLTIEQLIADPSVNDLLYKEPVWEKAYGRAINGKIGVAIPIHFKVRSFVPTGDKVGINFDNLNYLFIYKGNNGKLVAEWVTIYPDLEWANGNRKKYTGRIKVTDWDGNLKKVFSFDKSGKIVCYRKPTDNGLYLKFQNAENITTAVQGKLMGRKYKDVNGECWEDIREVPSSDGLGVTLIRKRIDCAELEPQGPSQPGDGNGDGYGAGGGNGNGTGGGAGGGSYIPINCNDDPSWDPSILPTLEGGLVYIDKCGSDSPVEPIEPKEPSEPDEPIEPAITPPSCRSFNFSKVTNNWQAAGVKNIFQTYVDLRYEIYIQIEYQPLYFQMPIKRTNGDDFSKQGVAATKSAEILQAAFTEGFYYFNAQVKLGKRGNELKSLVERRILEYADNIMNTRYGGNVTKNPPLGYTGNLTNYQDYYFFPDDCM